LEGQMQQIEADLARRRKERDALAKSVTESQERAALLKKIAARAAEVASFSNSVAQAVGQKNAIANRLVLTGMADFPRPYVSIVCGKESATVYAPKQPAKTIRPPIGGTDRAWLKTQLVTNRAVVVFARSSSFEDCYPKFFTEVLRIQDEEEQNKADVAVSFVPVQEHEDITGHILIGGGQ
jgi:hypothetical protein